RTGDRYDLLVHEPPDGDEVLPLLVGELLADGEEVRPEGFPEVRARHLRHHWLPSGVRSASRNAWTAAARRPESAASSRWPPWYTCSWLRGISRCMIRALTSGMIGSSSPARISVGGRSFGSRGRLVQPRVEISW